VRTRNETFATVRHQEAFRPSALGEGTRSVDSSVSGCLRFSHFKHCSYMRLQLSMRARRLQGALSGSLFTAASGSPRPQKSGAPRSREASMVTGGASCRTGPNWRRWREHGGRRVLAAQASRCYAMASRCRTGNSGCGVTSFGHHGAHHRPRHGQRIRQRELPSSAPNASRQRAAWAALLRHGPRWRRNVPIGDRRWPQQSTL